MLPSALPRFAEIARDLYLPRSFEAPPPRGATEAPPPHWLCFDPRSTSPEGADFNQFRQSEPFRLAQRQFLERLQDCAAFAKDRCSEREAGIIQEDLETFRQHLLEGDGDRFFDSAQLQLLYGLGKRCLDDFCLLLQCPDIDPHIRIGALREMAQQAVSCRGAGPAFVEAVNALRQREGTLRGEYWQVLKELFDGVVRRFVCEEMTDRDSDDDLQWLEAMEFHVVNRLRLELGLPGADKEDRASREMEVSPQEVSACAQALLTACRPVNVAAALAVQYRDRLQQVARTVLGLQGEAIDLNNETHMDGLMVAARQLAPTFEGVSMKSVVAQDPASGAFSWRQDHSLLIRELMHQLAGMGLIQPPVEETVVQGTTSDSVWALRHLDGRVPYVREQLRGVPVEAGELSCVDRSHLQRLLASGADQTLRDAAVLAVVTGESVALLASFPGGWVRNAEHLKVLMDRLGPQGARAWLKQQNDNDDSLRVLLRTATQGGNLPALNALVKQQTRTPSAMVCLAGPTILSDAIASDMPEVWRIWRHRVRSGLHQLRATELHALLSDRQGGPLVASLLLAGDEQLLGDVLGLLHQARRDQRITSADLVRLLAAPVQEAMMIGRADALKERGQMLARPEVLEWIGASDLQMLMEGPVAFDGCRSAVFAGRIDLVRWFQESVVDMTHAGRLTPAQAVGMLLSKGATNDAVGRLAICICHAELLSEHLSALLDAAARGWMSTSQLIEGLRCGDESPVSSVNLMMSERNGDLVDVWVDALCEAYQRQLLKQSDIFDLLMSPAYGPQAGPDGRMSVVAALPRLDYRNKYHHTLRAAEKLQHWGRSLQRLWEAQALSAPQVWEALRGMHGGVSALHAALAAAPANRNAARALLRLVMDARRNKLINGQQVVTLLEARSEANRTLPSVAMSNDDLHWWLSALRALEYGPEKLSRYVRLGMLEAVAKEKFDTEEAREAFSAPYRQAPTPGPSPT